MKWTGSHDKLKSDVPGDRMRAGSEENLAPVLWIFGYGSLIWNPGVRYRAAKRGYVEGYSRRFWQGNFTHRGTEVLPGRVVTLIPEKAEKTFGLLFKLTGASNIAHALEHLYVREIQAGYEFARVSVTLIDSNDPGSVEPVSALTCIATADSQFYLGPSNSLDSLADQIATAHGPAGPNADYLLNLAASMRTHFPQVEDDHLFELEAAVQRQLTAKPRTAVLNDVSNSFVV